MLDMAWLLDFGPMGAVVAVVIAMMRREQKRDKHLSAFFIEREKTLAAIGQNCHDFSAATDSRAEKREERLVAVLDKNERCFDKLLVYLTRVNGKTKGD